MSIRDRERAPTLREMSRSQAYWALTERRGRDAEAEWPAREKDLRAMRPELERLEAVDVRRARGEGAYREQGRGAVTIRRARGPRLSKAIGLGSLGFAVLAFSVVGRLSVLGIYYAIAMLSVAARTAYVLRSDHEVRVFGSWLRLVRKGQVLREIPRGDIAYVHTLPIEAPELAGTYAGVRRRVLEGTAVVCVRTTGGELIQLGGPVRPRTATALCAAIEDELRLLPDPAEGPRVRVETDTEPAEQALELESSARSESA